MKTFTLILALFAIFNSDAQKKILTVDDFASWNRIEKRQISRDGNFVSYELNEQKGNGKLIIRNIRNQTNDTIEFGYNALFSSNSDFIALKIKPSADTIRKAKSAKVKKNKMPEDSMAVFNFKTKELIKFPNIKSFKIPEKNSSWIAMLIKYQEIKSDTISAKDDKIKNSKNIKKSKKKNERNDLIIFNPTTKIKYLFKRTEEYTVAKEGKTIALLSKTTDTSKIAAVISFNTETLKIDTLLQDSLTIKNISLDRAGNQIAFLASADTIDEKIFSLYYTLLNKPNLQIIADTLTTGIPFNRTPGEKSKIYFSDDASKLFFGTAKKTPHQQKDTLLDEEKPKIDIWSWTDKELQPMQLINLKKEKKRTYLAVYRIKEKKVIQLADTIIKKIRLINKNNGETAIGIDDSPYKRASSWNGKRLNDYYLINVKTGEKKLILKEKSNANLSPEGKYTVWYELKDSSYYSLNNKTGNIISLTKNIPVQFCNELNDMPTDPYPYGIAGWSDNDTYLFIYDRFDIWKLDPKGTEKPVNITNNFGRKNKIRLRYMKLDDELVFIPTKSEVLIKGFNEENFSEGIYKLKLKEPQTPSSLISGDFRISSIRKAKDTDKIIWSKQTIREYPEIRFCNLNFSNIEIISKTNPQQSEFNWASVETVKWKSFTGDTLKGLLYKPENFDAAKKYPMIVYFYERSSYNIHHHYIPSPSRSIINKTFYASNGYLVFVPDITYTTGYPGQNAYDAVVSGVNYLINTCNYVNGNKIGLQGQSWGGYQIAYLVTQTDMFAAAMAGAPVSNMTSAYGGIRWGSGMSRMFQYEHKQSRIGGTLWERPLLYIENSPLFHAPKVKTPLLIMHNDKDGAVPWYQGIEYFVALRRLNKPVWLLNYNGMKHNIESKYWADRMDLSIRMFQFFNHYLKDKPAPEWMIKGIPAIEKGENLGY